MKNMLFHRKITIKTSYGSGIGGKWSKDEDEALRNGVDTLGCRSWKQISEEYLQGRRSDVQCLHRWQKVFF